MSAQSDHAARADQSPIAMLERWEQHGAIWRTASLSGTEATVELLTCHGELVDELRASDVETLGYLAARPRSDVDPDRVASRQRGEDVGKASFPASDPPACWTWDVDSAAGAAAKRS